MADVTHRHLEMNFLFYDFLRQDISHGGSTMFSSRNEIPRSAEE